MDMSLPAFKEAEILLQTFSFSTICSVVCYRHTLWGKVIARKHTQYHFFVMSVPILCSCLASKSDQQWWRQSDGLREVCQQFVERNDNK